MSESFGSRTGRAVSLVRVTAHREPAVGELQVVGIGLKQVRGHHAGLADHDRGDLLARLISDTDEAQDLVVRAVVPVLSAAAAWLAAVAAVAVLLPAAGLALLAAGAGGAAGITGAVLLAGRNAAALPAARGDVGSWILGVLDSREELAAVGAVDWALAQLAARERALGVRTRSVAAATGLGRACAAVAGGAGLAAVAWAGGAARRSGRVSPAELSVLIFVALALGGCCRACPTRSAACRSAGHPVSGWPALAGCRIR